MSGASGGGVVVLVEMKGILDFVDCSRHDEGLFVGCVVVEGL